MALTALPSRRQRGQCPGARGEGEPGHEVAISWTKLPVPAAGGPHPDGIPGVRHIFSGNVPRIALTDDYAVNLQVTVLPSKSEPLVGCVPTRQQRGLTTAAYRTHGAALVRADATRRDSSPAPLLPGLMRRGRSASVTLTSPHFVRPRSGSLRLHSVREKVEERRAIRNRGGGNDRTHGRGRCKRKPVQMTGEGAQGAALHAACVEYKSAITGVESAWVPIGAPFSVAGFLSAACCSRSVGCSAAALVPGLSRRLRWPPRACATAMSAGLP
jgi:hypothetical protein